jgi:large subunit ribosomal protein L15
MVIRIKSKRSKYHGTRTCGAGNTKNRRGKGNRGGVGRGGRKHRFIFRVINEESIKKKGFEPWRRTKLDEADLDRVSKKINEAEEDKPTIELKGFKILGDGKLSKPAVIKASGFSKRALEKIKEGGGEAVKF